MSRSKGPRKAILWRAPPDLAARVQELADEAGRPMNEQVTRLIQAALGPSPDDQDESLNDPG
jgi:hypothetical protein